jgi:hypothetical protein
MARYEGVIVARFDLSPPNSDLSKFGNEIVWQKSEKSDSLPREASLRGGEGPKPQLRP